MDRLRTDLARYQRMYEEKAREYDALLADYTRMVGELDIAEQENAAFRARAD